MQIPTWTTKNGKGVSLIEIMFAMGIMAMAFVPIMGVMQSGQQGGVRLESEVEAGETANKIITTLMSDVPFISIMPSTAVPWHTNLVTSVAALNKADSGGDVIVDHPTTFKNEAEYMESLFHKSTGYSYIDDRGIKYIISLNVQVVPISLKYFETNEKSSWKGNLFNSAYTWDSKALVDETGSSTTDVIFGDGSVAGSNSPAPYKYLAGDKIDSRFKKLTVSIAYEKKKGAFSRPDPWKNAKTIHLVAYKSKLED